MRVVERDRETPAPVAMVETVEMAEREEAKKGVVAKVAVVVVVVKAVVETEVETLRDSRQCKNQRLLIGCGEPPDEGFAGLEGSQRSLSFIWTEGNAVG